VRINKDISPKIRLNFSAVNHWIINADPKILSQSNEMERMSFPLIDKENNFDKFTWKYIIKIWVLVSVFPTNFPLKFFPYFKSLKYIFSMKSIKISIFFEKWFFSIKSIHHTHLRQQTIFFSENVKTRGERKLVFHE
jgi:hypothetical protein